MKVEKHSEQSTTNPNYSPIRPTVNTTFRAVPTNPSFDSSVTGFTRESIGSLQSDTCDFEGRYTNRFSETDTIRLIDHMDVEEISLSDNIDSGKHSKTSHTPSRLYSVGKAFRRASTRVIELSTTCFDNPIPSHGNSDQKHDHNSLDDVPIPQQHRLGGRSLFLFGPNNPTRIYLARLFNRRWMGYLITLLIVLNWLLLCVQYWEPGARDFTFGFSWTDYPLLVIFILYTFETIARIIVSGFIINPPTSQQRQPRVEIGKKSPFLVVEVHSEIDSLFPDRAYLRHSFQRIDFVVVVSFWVNMILMLTGYGRFTVFSALSALRPFRLISMTSGSWTILRSLKKSAPVLVNVSLFLLCFFLLFGIIGVISFEGSFDRRCVSQDYQESDYANLESFVTVPERYCGHYNETSKGYRCPANFNCVNVGNPFEGTLGYDNIFQTVPILFGITAAQGWLSLMFQTMDAEYPLPSALYYIIGVVVFNFWLLNLFVAVITEMFAKIREDTNHSAFTSRDKAAIVLNDGNDELDEQGKKKIPSKPNFLQRNFDATYYFWILLVAADLVIMCVRSYDPDDEDNVLTPDPTMIQGDFLTAERVFTSLFALEIILRYFAILKPGRRSKFFHSKRNRLDLFLAVVTCLIQIPPIPTVTSGMVYRYLTVFQVARFYRVVMAVPRLRRLITRTVGNVIGMMNLFLFILMCIGVSATMAMQLFGGQIGSEDGLDMNFDNFASSFLALFQVFSGDNWTDLLYGLTGSQRKHNMAVFSSVFILLFFCFSNFILLNMLVAVIVENFEMDEEEKRKLQLEETIKGIETRQKEGQAVISKWNPYRFLKPSPKALEVDSIPSNLVLPVQKRAAREFLQESTSKSIGAQLNRSKSKGFTSRVRRFLKMDYDDVELGNTVQRAETRDDRFIDEAAGSKGPSMEQHSEREAILNDFMTAHPTYDTSLFIFKRNHPIRKICKKLVGNSDPSIEGVSLSHFKLSHAFNGFIFVCVVVSVVFAAINTPLAQRQRIIEKYGSLDNYTSKREVDIFYMIDIIVTAVFTIEFLIRIIADGFMFTPEAYWRSIWNRVDFLVLITLYITLAINPRDATGIPRTLRAAKGFRALRIASYFSAVREVFYGTLYSGFPRIVDAALLSLCFILPFSIYGLNIFAGLMYSCNDDNGISSRAACSGFYPDKDNGFLKPRVWSNPDNFNFDNFRSSLLVLFEIVSNEGWVDVMLTTMKVKGYNLQPEDKNAWYNAIFFMIYNMVGAVFVLTLFVAVIIENFNTRNGTAFLTAEQRRWIDMKNQLKQIKPSIRPVTPPVDRVRRWCYEMAIEKNGFLSKFVIGVTIFDALLLVTQYHTQPDVVDTVKDILFGLIFLCYMFEIVVKCLGLGVRTVLMNPWNVFDIVITFGLAISSISQLVEKFVLGIANGSRLSLRIFVTLVLFKVVQKIDSLHQLLRTMAVSLRTIVNLLAVWFLVFVIYAIAFMEIFSLTKMGENGGARANFRNFSNSILNLLGMSTGEGWNDFMHDFVTQSPECVASDSYYLQTDCGSPAWAYFLFISFNIISMYIFANLFVVVVMDGFSYCYQIASSYSLMKRDDIRNFKKAWGEVDIHGNGYIYQKDIVKLFSKLSAPFDVKIYPDQYSIPTLLRECRAPENLDVAPSFSFRKSSKRNIYELTDQRPEAKLPDFNILNTRLSDLNSTEIHERRRIYNLIYQEAMDLGANNRKISFTKMLLLLSIYKLTDPVKSFLYDLFSTHLRNMLHGINECFSFSPTDYIKRKERMDQIVDKVRMDTLRGFLLIAIQRKRIREIRAQSDRHAEFEHPQTPETQNAPDAIGPEIRIVSESSTTRHHPTSTYTPERPAVHDIFPHSSASPGYVDESDDNCSVSSLKDMDISQADDILTDFRSNQWHDALVAETHDLYESSTSEEDD
ncbi:hypothetical protein K493DRAFT_333364 [Basidiobolus meristosporus CBS 931.73]|uniref:Calcium-channel protein CCH1 n=1 Tax=Basidiobolus meristosporus CBS 931.73 TaxID=1314790 RepID=A0A1Y1Z6J2_9FUNG|nr:hypothetical protein K493DRAFT_333364 [Basidiobolus meristosporus CBS 931.73]|eukprot:ORY05860.1 hypothetical protein K493DRAFT_333364 [Basidiobolus meristosporus CBS 931.73]